MCYNQYFKLILVIVLMLNDVYSWNYYRSYQQIDGSRACTFSKCKNDERCMNRKFSCKYPPCPNMIYCAKTDAESLRGPSSCDSVQCSKGHICIVKIRHCKWNKPCGEELARCVSEIEYYNGPASCAGFKCPVGRACILRETFCVRPPCKLLRSCVSKRDYNSWMDKCKTLGCLSSHECFLRRPGNVCESSVCKHTPDCTAKTDDELLSINPKCRGWICPRSQVCEAISQEACVNFDCKIYRTCIEDLDDFNNQNESENHLKNPPKISTAQLRTGLQPTSDVNKNNFKPGEIIQTEKLLNNFNPTLSSLSLWVDYLQNKTDIEAVKNWVQKAEDANDYAGFRQWLDLVKELFGVKAYARWLEEIREITVSSKPFQQWLLSYSNISKLINNNQSSVSSRENIDLDNNSNWKSFGNDSKNGIYSTEGLMNPFYQQQNIAFPPLNASRIPILFTPGNHQNDNLRKHYGYYILPSINYSVSHENPRQSTIEPDERSMLKQLDENSDSIDVKKKVSLVNLLQKLKKERLLYQDVINKTQKLVSRVQPLFPPSHLDELVEKLRDNKLQLTTNSDPSSVVTPRILPENPKNIEEQENSSSAEEITGKNYDNNDNYYDDGSFFLVDYNEPTLNISETLPRIHIKVENNMKSSGMEIGEIGVKYHDDDDNDDDDDARKFIKNSSDSQRSTSNNGNPDDEDYYTDDLHYNLKFPVKNTDISKT